MDLIPSKIPELKESATPTLSWLKESIAINGGQGSSAFYSRLHYPFRGWSPSYPETTGYLIPTLLQYHSILPDQDLKTQALLCGEWLLSIQHPEGWFPALYQNSGKPSLFNTAMILFGLVSLFKTNKAERYRKGITNALQWCRQVATENNWKELHNSTKRTYYTRAIWALLEAEACIDSPELKTFCEKAIHSFLKEIGSDGWIQNWEFEGQNFAFTHTMAYTWRGFFEAGHILGDEIVLGKALRSFDIFLKKIDSDKNLYGAYFPDWKNDDKFLCLPGTFQLSILAFRAFELSADPKYKKWGHYFWKAGNEKLPTTIFGMEGGIFGSNPIGGKYMNWKQVNWGAKFYLDALWLYIKYKEDAR